MKRRSEQPAEHVRAVASPLDEAISRRQFLAAAGAGGALLLLPGVPETASAARRAWTAQPGNGVVIQWNDAFLQGVRDSKLGPPMVARALAIGHTCIYDAWAAYERPARSSPRCSSSSGRSSPASETSRRDISGVRAGARLRTSRRSSPRLSSSRRSRHPESMSPAQESPYETSSAVAVRRDSPSNVDCKQESRPNAARKPRIGESRRHLTAPVDGAPIGSIA